jgi:hypothetical protein
MVIGSDVSAMDPYVLKHLSSTGKGGGKKFYGGSKGSHSETAPQLYITFERRME